MDLIDEAYRKGRAKHCTNCLQWHKICKAACCSFFKINKRLLRDRGSYYIMTRQLSKDRQHYYSIRGCHVMGRNLIIKKQNFEISKIGGFIHFKRPCDYLDGYMCSVHGTDKKPKICQIFDENKAIENDIYFVVPECLANYKEVQDD